MTIDRINTFNETHLHAALKRYLMDSGDQLEQEVDGYIVDIVRDDLLIEVQTGNFAAIKRKLIDLLTRHRVRLVLPVAQARWIVKLDEAGERISRRKSPKRGSVEQVFTQLVAFPLLVNHPHFTLEVLLTHEEELRQISDRYRNWRRRGWGTVERRLLDVVGRYEVRDSADCLALLPSELPDPFTTADLATALNQPRRLAQQMAYCLREMEAIDLIGKKKRAHLYSPRAV